MVAWGLIFTITAFVFSILFAVAGFFVPSFLDGIVRKKVVEKKVLSLHDNDELLEKFKNPPFPMKMNIWVYNITNALSLVSGDEHVAHLNELGPYTFRVKMRKEVRFNQDETRLFYRTFRTFTYDHSCANCSLEDDEVVVASPAYQEVVHKTADSFIKSAFLNSFEFFTRWEDLHKQYRRLYVKELLFDGYVDEEIEKAGPFQKNNTNEDGEYEVDTGKVDVANIGHVYSWNALNGSLNESYWFGEEARVINGTDSQLYPPFQLLNRENFQMFIGQACRSVEMEFDGYSVVDGMPALRYSPAKSMQVNISQKGFCGDRQDQKFFDDQSDNCPPHGLMEMDGCNPLARRIFVSGGHFYGADPRLRDSLAGFAEPNREKDITYLDIEPHIGLVVQAESRSLISLGIKGAKLENVMPLIMVSNSAHFDDATRELVTKVLNLLYITAWVVHLILFTLSFIFGGIAVLIFVRQYFKYHITEKYEGGKLYATASTSKTNISK